MDAVGFSESAPPLYYALAWLWTQVTGTGEFGLRSLSALAGVATVPVAYLLGARAARPPRRAHRPRRWSRSTRCCSGTRRRRAPTRCWSCFCALSLLYCVRALRAAAAAATSSLWGVASALALATHYFAVFPIAAEAVWLLRRRGRASRRRARRSSPSPGSRWRRWRSTRCRYGHAEWIGNFSLGHRLWETGGDLRHRRDRRHHRPPERPLLALVPLAAGRRPRSLLLALRGERGRAPRRRRSRSRSPAATVGVPLVLALLAAGKDFVLARNLMPALVPLLVAVAIGAHPAGRARRLGIAIAAVLVAYSLGFCVWASFSPALQRPDWDAVGQQPRRTDGAAGDGHLDPGRGLAALLPLDRLVPGRPRPKATTGWSHEIDFVSDGRRRRRPRGLLGPGFREVGYAKTSAGSTSAATARRGPAWRRCGCGESARRPARTSAQRRPPRRHRAGLTGRASALRMELS